MCDNLEQWNQFFAMGTRPLRHRSSQLQALVRVAIVIAVSTAMPAYAVAQTSPSAVVRGSVNAAAYANIPESSEIAIDFREDTELNTRLLSLFHKALSGHGHMVASDAELVLMFSMAIDSSAPPNQGVKLSAEGDSEGLANAEVTVAVPARTGRKNSEKTTRYRLEANLLLMNKTSIWKGSASVTARAGRDRFEVARTMVHSLMAEFGATVRDKDFVI